MYTDTHRQKSKTCEIARIWLVYLTLAYTLNFETHVSGEGLYKHMRILDFDSRTFDIALPIKLLPM